ncbi:MAG TPA: OB-fold domain-containing protein, partial [Acidimicrobiales bacterium]|nr:OB-fold domain-containing protein [Acidimicrobiales bacterium]
TRPVPGAASVPGALSGGTAVGYLEVLKARGQLTAQSDPIPMGVPPGSAAFVRGNVEMLALEGARCRTCATVSTPPSIHPTCTGCGGSDLEVVALARRGTVQTFVVNQTMPPPFQAPLPLLVIDLDDGARLMLQGTSADAPVLAIGDTVALTLRRYAVERGIPVYGYKALRVAGEADGRPDEAGAGNTRSKEVAR